MFCAFITAQGFISVGMEHECFAPSPQLWVVNLILGITAIYVESLRPEQQV